jgi:hypothetical protein
VQGNLAFPARRKKEYASGQQVPLNRAAIDPEDHVHRSTAVQDHEKIGDGIEAPFEWALPLH